MEIRLGARLVLLPLVFASYACHHDSLGQPDLTATVDLSGASATDLSSADVAATSDLAETDVAVAPDLATPDLYVPMASLAIDRAPSYNFGDVVAGVPSGTVDFVVSNGGPDPSGVILAAAITGADASAFGIAADGCAGKTLTTSDTCVVQLFAQSSTAGTPTATLTVASPGSNASVSLGATILAPGSITASPSPAPFGDVEVGKTKDVTITFTNDGGSDTGVLSFDTSGAGSTEFSITGGTCGSSTKLAATKSCTVIVHWAPLVVATRSVTLNVTAAPGGPVAVNMTGNAYTPAALAFGAATYTPLPNTPVDKGASATIDLELHNNGSQASGPLPTLKTITNFVFAVTGGTCQAGQPVPGGGSCTIEVTFSPNAYGPISDGISVSATPGGTASATLDATGRETFTLTIKRLGTGTGTVSVDGTPCGAYPCTVDYPTSGTPTSVSISATPDVSSSFGSWTSTPVSGGCSSSASCTLTMDRNREEDATFAIKTFTVNVALNGVRGATGQVTADVAPPLVCNATSCSGTYPYNTNVTLTAAATGGNLFQSWSATPCASRFATTCGTGPLTGDFSTSVTFRPKINYAFVTSQRIAVSTLGADLLVADRFCDKLARDAGLVDTPMAPGAPYFKALLATTTKSARGRIDTAKGWIRTDGHEFASDPKDIFRQVGATNPGQTFYPLSYSELGTTVLDDYVATGSDGFGDLAPGSNCNDWTTNTGCGAGVALGEPYAAGDNWLFRQANCSCGDWRLYCFETGQPPTAVAPPVPTDRRVAFVSTGKFAGGTSRDTADTLCKNEAASASLPGTFISLLPVTGKSAAFRLDTGLANWVRPDNVPIAATTTDFINGTWLVPMAETAGGTYVAGFYQAWVAASSPAETPSDDSQTCTSWTQNTGYAGYMLSAASPGYQWQSAICNSMLHVLCIQQ